jgi:hypothetical protein
MNNFSADELKEIMKAMETLRKMLEEK